MYWWEFTYFCFHVEHEYLSSISQLDDEAANVGNFYPSREMPYFQNFCLTYLLNNEYLHNYKDSGRQILSKENFPVQLASISDT